jgi:hypothetical protein
MFYLETQPYQGPVTVCKRSPITGARLSEDEVTPSTIKAQLRARPEANTIETPISAKARISSEWSQWLEDRKARFEQEASNA